MRPWSESSASLRRGKLAQVMRTINVIIGVVALLLLAQLLVRWRKLGPSLMARVLFGIVMLMVAASSFTGWLSPLSRSGITVTIGIFLLALVALAVYGFGKIGKGYTGPFFLFLAGMAIMLGAFMSPLEVGVLGFYPLFSVGCALMILSFVIARRRIRNKSARPESPDAIRKGKP
jgi:hypothetical protein